MEEKRGRAEDLREQIAADATLSRKEKYSDAYFLRPSVVYFIAAGNGSDPIAVKIGVTARNTVKKRLTSIQSSNHERVHLLAVKEFLEGDKPGLAAEREETELHRKFASLQRAKAWTVGAEWFSWDPEIKNYIASLPELPEDLKHLAL